MEVPFFDLKRQYQQLEPELTPALKKVFASGVFILGEQGEAFEKKLADFIGVQFGIGVNSGTDALKISLKALGIGEGDEVITVSNTAVPTVSALREIDALPRFVDVREDCLINESQLEPALSSKTKAIIPVHLYGQPCNIKAILKWAEKHDLKVIEDCAQAHGATVGGQKAGSFGHLSCFSFYPTKNLGAYGDGGMILTADSGLAEKCRCLRMYGMKEAYKAGVEGYNSRLDEIQAAILKVKLKYLAEWNQRRQKIASFYLKNINHPLITLPLISQDRQSAFHLFVIRCYQRGRLLRYLKKNKIGFKVHYPQPIHLQKAYAFLGYQRGDFPMTERLAAEIVSLPLFPEMRGEEMEYVVKKVNSF